jgi:hypothetical protein
VRSTFLRTARIDVADRIAERHALSWQRTYRGMMTDEFLDRRALANRRQVWHDRLQAGITKDGPRTKNQAPRTKPAYGRGPNSVAR